MSGPFLTKCSSIAEVRIPWGRPCTYCVEYCIGGDELWGSNYRQQFVYRNQLQTDEAQHGSRVFVCVRLDPLADRAEDVYLRGVERITDDQLFYGRLEKKYNVFTFGLQ